MLLSDSIRALSNLSLFVQNADNVQFASKVYVADAESLSRFNEYCLQNKEFAIDLVSDL